MDKKEIKALRRPFIKELFRNNKFNLAITIFSTLLAAATELLISWLLKEVTDLIAATVNTVYPHFSSWRASLSHCL